MKISMIFCMLTVMGIMSCLDTSNNQTTTEQPVNTVMDVHSFANPQEAVATHLNLELKADFDTKQLSGTATYDVKVFEGGDSIHFDTRDLDIHQVTVDGTKTDFTLGNPVEWLGQRLTVPVSPTTKKIVISKILRRHLDIHDLEENDDKY